MLVKKESSTVAYSAKFGEISFILSEQLVKPLTNDINNERTSDGIKAVTLTATIGTFFAFADSDLACSHLHSMLDLGSTRTAFMNT